MCKEKNFKVEVQDAQGDPNSTLIDKGGIIHQISKVLTFELSSSWITDTFSKPRLKSRTSRLEHNGCLSIGSDSVEVCVNFHFPFASKLTERAYFLGVWAERQRVVSTGVIVSGAFLKTVKHRRWHGMRFGLTLLYINGYSSCPCRPRGGIFIFTFLEFLPPAGEL